jgi:preprotein translocase subunit SecD
MNGVNGYNINPMPPPDPQFASVPSTSVAADRPSARVLLPGSSSSGTDHRFVLGPAALTATSIKDASASFTNSDQWLITITLTGAGVGRWDALAQKQFHALVAVVVNNEVVTAPIIEPTQSSFTSFNGQLLVSGNFSARQAKVIAAELQP